MYRICITDHFDAAHHLVGYQGACARPHGHRWTIQMNVEGRELDSRGMLIDFKLVKDILEEEVLSKLDHYDLNEIPAFNEGWENNPTAENISKFIYDKLNGIQGLKEVRVYESPDSSATYSPD